MAESKNDGAGTSADYYQQAAQLGQIGQTAQHYDSALTRYQHPPPGADYMQAEQPRQITRLIYSAQLEGK